MNAQAVERHERDAPALVLHHAVEDLGCGRVRVDDDLEQAACAREGREQGCTRGVREGGGQRETTHLVPAVTSTAVL